MEHSPPFNAYVTLLTKPLFLPGVLVLDHSLRSVGSRYPLVVMVTPGVPREVKDVLEKRGIRMRGVESLLPVGNLQAPLYEERLVDTWSKLRAFELHEFKRVVLLDSDMLIKRNMDDLFDLDLADDQIGATFVCACNPRKLKHYPADWTPKNCPYTRYAEILASPTQRVPDAPRPHGLLNSGTVVLNPSKELAKNLFNFFSTNDELFTYIFPDQDLLAKYFSRKWKLIPWYCNALRTLRSIHPDVWNDEEAHCIHYILPDKPWLSRKNPDPNARHFGILHDWWWQSFDEIGLVMESADAEGWKLVLKHVDVKGMVIN